MGLFDNASSVTINGTEVQSITTNNNGLIFQKDQYAITLTANKNSVNVDEPITFSVRLTNNGTPVSDEIVDLCGIALDTPVSRSISANTTVHVGCKYSFAYVARGGYGINNYLNRERTHYFTYDAVDEFKIRGPGANGNDNSTNLVMNNGVLSYRNAGQNYTTSLGNTDFNTLIAASAMTINDYGIYDTTDENGEATMTYTPTSAGTQTVTARYRTTTNTIQIEVT